MLLVDRLDWGRRMLQLTKKRPSGQARKKGGVYSLLLIGLCKIPDATGWKQPHAYITPERGESPRLIHFLARNKATATKMTGVFFPRGRCQKAQLRLLPADVRQEEKRGVHGGWLAVAGGQRERALPRFSRGRRRASSAACLAEEGTRGGAGRVQQGRRLRESGVMIILPGCERRLMAVEATTGLGKHVLVLVRKPRTEPSAHLHTK